LSAGSVKRDIFVWSGARQHFFDIFSVIWQVQTYRRLCYLLMAVPLGLIYSIGLVIGLLFPITLIYLAAFEAREVNTLANHMNRSLEMTKRQMAVEKCL
jgi:hypothetical protein